MSLFLALGLTYTPLPAGYKTFVVFCAWLGFLLCLLGWLLADAIDERRLNYGVLSTVVAGVLGGVAIALAWWFLVVRAPAARSNLDQARILPILRGTWPRAIDLGCSLRTKT